MPAPVLRAFISYSHDDSKFALRLAEDLKAAGAFIWLDQLDIKVGHSWDNAIEEALGDAAQMILILSPASAQSKNVRDEISFALSKGKEIIPVLHKTCDVPLRLQRSQRIDFRNDYAVGLALLLQHLQGGALQVAVSTHPTRRRVLVAGASAATALAGGAWFAWPRLEHLLQPLPDKRFVALMAWPGGDSSSVLSTVLDSMRARLARAEAKVKDLLIVSSSDLPKDAPAPANPAQAITSLGANLVLAATLQSGASGASLSLQVLDAATQRVLRKTKVSRKPAQLSELPEAASAAAEQLLGLPNGGAPLKDEDELKSVSQQVFQLYSDAEQLMAQPNHTGLKAAIPKYGDAVSLNTHFALGFAKLSMAHIQQYLITNDPSDSSLASINAEKAIGFNPTSVAARFSQALVFLYTGKLDAAFASFAKALQADPGNSDTLFYEAQAYRDAGKVSQAEQVYRDILNVRPNYWLANNELGYLLNSQGKFKEAVDAYSAAASSHPEVAWPMASLGAVYLEMGKTADAIAACNDSIIRSPNYPAYMTLGDIAFGDKKYSDALNYYLKAKSLNPTNHVIWRDMGDCYAALNQPGMVRSSYATAAELLGKILSVNPKNGPDWAALAFYYAKTGDKAGAESAMKKADALGAKDLDSQLYIVQALALQGKNDEALKLLLVCLDHGLAPISVDMSYDLQGLKKDPRYIARVSQLQSRVRAAKDT